MTYCHRHSFFFPILDLISLSFVSREILWAILLHSRVLVCDMIRMDGAQTHLLEAC